MINVGETSSETSMTDTQHRSGFNFGISRITNWNTSNRSSWLRSIPRRIRRFISKSNKQFGQTTNETLNNSARFNSTGSFNLNRSITGNDESNLIIDIDDDEEIAMKVARSQMAK